MPISQNLRFTATVPKDREFDTRTTAGLIGSPGGLPLPAPTPPYMRVRVRRFLAVLYGLSSTLSLPRWSLAGSSADRLHRSGTRPPMVVSACQVQPFPGCESFRFLRLDGPFSGPRLVSPG